MRNYSLFSAVFRAKSTALVRMPENEHSSFEHCALSATNCLLESCEEGDSKLDSAKFYPAFAKGVLYFVC